MSNKNDRVCGPRGRPLSCTFDSDRSYDRGAGHCPGLAPVQPAGHIAHSERAHEFKARQPALSVKAPLPPSNASAAPKRRNPDKTAPTRRGIALDTPEREKLTRAMLADRVKNVFPDQRFKFHAADPLTGKRDMRELGG